MNELIEEVELLKKELNNTNQVKDIKKLNKEIRKEEELLKKIEEYNKNNNEELKKEIISNPIFKEYKHKETELNLLILELNQKLKNIKDKKACK